MFQAKTCENIPILSIVSAKFVGPRCVAHCHSLFLGLCATAEKSSEMQCLRYFSCDQSDLCDRGRSYRGAPILCCDAAPGCQPPFFQQSRAGAQKKKRLRQVDHRRRSAIRVPGFLRTQSHFTRDLRVKRLLKGPVRLQHLHRDESSRITSYLDS
jgi:hypothetical protein